MSSIMNINSILPFNGSADMPAAYEAPRDKFAPRGKIVLLDCSSSMRGHQEEFKLTLSMLKALAGMPAMPPVPSPAGSTNLIGKVRKIVEAGDLGEQELVIVTDGLDNNHEFSAFQVGVTESGEPRVVHVKPDDFDDNDEYMRARQDAILQHLEYLGANVHLIGVGNEVKELLAMAASRRMTVAHLPRGSSAADVASVVTAAMSTVRSAPLPRDDFATAEMHAAAAESRVVTVENLCGHSPVEEEEAQALVKSAALVYVGDDAFSVEAFKCTFAAAEDAAAVPECARKYTRAVVMWLLGIALDNGNTPMPGAAIGGRFPVFAPPEGPGDWPVNKLLFQLRVAGLLTSEKKDVVTMVIQGHSRNFKDVACYAAAPRAAHLVKIMAGDADWAVPPGALIQKAQKRKRGV